MFGAHCGDGEQRVGAVTGWKWRQRVLNGKDNRSSGGRIIAKPGTKAEAGFGVGWGTRPQGQGRWVCADRYKRRAYLGALGVERSEGRTTGG